MSGVAGQSGPPGNTNSSAEKRSFANAVRRAAVQNDGERLRKVVDRLFDNAEAGEVQAIKEIADRLDGKPAQQVNLAGADGEPLHIVFEQKDSSVL